MKNPYFIGKSIVIFLFVFALSGCAAIETKQTEQTEVKTAETTIPEPIKEISYKIVSETDNSYAGCKRVGIRIVVPDDSEKIEVEAVITKIIDGNKSKWEDITVWAYKNSEENLIGNIGFTMGMKEYSTCK